jgi:hypothetical protein
MSTGRGAALLHLIIGSLKEKARRPLTSMLGIASESFRVGLLIKTYLNTPYLKI